MGYLLTFLSALTSVVGNIAAKYWSDSQSTGWIVLTVACYSIGTALYVWSLRYGKFTLLTALFYTLVPILTLLTGAFLFRDKLTPFQLWGIVLSVVGILLFTFEGKLVN